MESEILILIIGVLFGLLAWFFKWNFDQFNRKFDKLEKWFINHENRVSHIEGKLEMNNEIKNFSESQSPLKLKEKYKEVVLKSDIDEQIEKQKQKIVDLIQSKNPPTRLDAQNIIQENIDEIISWFDLTDLKNKMYEGGMSYGTEKALFTVYLYEIIIPLLKFENKLLKNIKSRKN